MNFRSSTAPCDNGLRVLICIFGLSWLLGGCSSSDGDTEVRLVRPVKTLVLQTPEQQLTVSFPGRLEPVHEVNLAFEVPGRLEHLPVSVGDSVTEGALIAQLNQEAYRARLEATKARYHQARSDSQRLQTLLATNNVSQNQVDEARTRLDVASSQLALDTKAYADTTLRAPFDGQVVAVYLDNFTYLPASTQVARLVDLSQFEVWVDVPERFAKLRSRLVEHRAYVEVDAFPGQWIEARFKEFGHEASRQTRTYPASFVIDRNDAFSLLPGMSAKVRVEVERKPLGLPEGLQVPVSAVFTRPAQHQSAVWVVEEDRIVYREIVLGDAQGEHIEVTEGLAAGEEIVIAGVHQLKEGQAVSERVH
ncbi:efflux RND transporter periplasmic adaptor subunit [Pseudomaricurvus alkylphenolicus]|uniref:efflux RND transporter periplasmic adaptor subunit n=1 Tax=Pseudomaricurvus alkylphenolicus TaxID=1306991 RepID=UPI0014243EAE|nr:efflux RND transporter periplasmic adaptor subunit [Pseudomaricurvus alkylphenolicus]NIB38811.1 efflux RND transporter periplasmic adaptor subunit [Pseudomaricurvus alkylphenolicus]